MPVQKASGEENLRANPSVNASTPNASPAGAGTDAGGKENLRANPMLKAASVEGKQVQTYAKDSRPAGVQAFNDRP